ncbi:hypothetical protein [Occultella kanbiaonis]|uniref:hypothetical protein n=1 Tax=Occultella kanbiaonis TaxID=2675754 RepID=UPI0012B8E946|nr:hypothetical protein [Occultella kanbiaonis]
MLGEDPSRGAVTVDEPTKVLIARPEEVTHLVCCRDEVWRVAFCGAESHEINMAAERLCAMCVEVVLRVDPRFYERQPILCAKDRRPCPTEHEVNLRVIDEIGP